MKKYKFTNCKTQESFIVEAKNWTDAEKLANVGKRETTISGRRYYWMHRGELIK